MLAVAYATGRASHARQVKGDDPDKNGYPGPQGWGLGVRLTTPPRKKILLRNLKKRKKLAASSMLHEAKIAYYAFDVIVYCMYTHQTRIAYTKRTH